VEVAILAVPVAVAQEITDRLVEAGVKALLSYVPSHLIVPQDVQVSYSDPVVQMQRMTYYLAPQSTAESPSEAQTLEEKNEPT